MAFYLPSLNVRCHDVLTTDMAVTVRIRIYHLGCMFLAVFVFYYQIHANSVKADSLKKNIESIEPLSISQHSITIKSQQLRYSAIAGRLPIGDLAEKPDAFIFFTAYILQPQKTPNRRALTFVFNGGPGGSSVWLHLGAAGPRRVPLGKDGVILPDKDTLNDNSNTWLTFTDLVFVDPVGTGYSRAAAGVNSSKFYSVDGDIKSTAEFIKGFLSRFERWQSPLFVAGESYGTTRAAGVSNYLQSNYALVIRGLILLSSALDFQLLSFNTNSDLPYVLILPAYTAVAWYHQCLSETLTKMKLLDVITAAQHWASGDYLEALYQGGRLSDSKRKKTADSLVFYTGLPLSLIKKLGMRIDLFTFAQELLASRDSAIGILDGRISGLNFSLSSDLPYKDPSLFVISAPYATMINDYLQRDLGYKTPLQYVYLSSQINKDWNWENSTGQGYLTVVPQLRVAMSINSQLRIFAGMGFYDLTTPYLSQLYAFEHLGNDGNLLDRVTLRQYSEGHQIYTSESGLKALTSDLKSFYEKF